MQITSLFQILNHVFCFLKELQVMSVPRSVQSSFFVEVRMSEKATGGKIMSDTHFHCLMHSFSLFTYLGSSINMAVSKDSEPGSFLRPPVFSSAELLDIFSLYVFGCFVYFILDLKTRGTSFSFGIHNLSITWTPTASTHSLSHTLTLQQLEGNFLKDMNITILLHCVFTPLRQ